METDEAMEILRLNEVEMRAERAYEAARVTGDYAQARAAAEAYTKAYRESTAYALCRITRYNDRG